MNRMLYILICIISMAIMPTKSNAVQSLGTPSDNVFIISIPGLSFKEIHPEVLLDYPHLLKLSEEGVVGALNIRTPYKGIEDSYLTIGAGAMATSKEDYNGMHRDEIKDGDHAAVLYERYGLKLRHTAHIIVPEIVAIQGSNAATHYRSRPGLLGDVLEGAGIGVAVFGNRDRGHAGDGAQEKSSLKRVAPLMLMNGQGLIDHGAVDRSMVVTDRERPFGIKTNYARILQQLGAMSGPTVSLIELGDLDRLYVDKGVYSGERFKHLKAIVLQEIDAFVGSIVAQMAPTDRLMILSPEVNPEAEKGKSLFSPFFLYRQGLVAGIVTSDTTHRAGIIANIDLAPTILASYHLDKPSGMIGFPIHQQPKEGNLTWLHGEVHDIEQVYRMRPLLLYPFVIYQMIVLLAGLLLAFQNKIHFAYWMGIPLISVLIAPIVLLRLNVLFSLPDPLIIAVFFAMILMFATLLHRLPSLITLGVISLVTAGLLAIDGFSGAEWMKRSVLGYDPMIGARYYGIGNEYTGVLIGAAVLLVSLVAHYFYAHFPRLIILICSLLFISLLVYLASPSLGTNAGGAIAAMVAFGLAWMRMFSGKKLRELRWLWLLLLVSILGIIAVAGLWLLNGGLISGAAQQSHIGRAMHMLLTGRFDVVGDIIARKLTMNWHLMGVSSWSKVLVTSLFVIMVIVLRPRGILSRWQVEIPYIMHGFVANAVGSIVILLTNHSGIVAAATMIIYVAVPMLIIKLHDMRASHSS